MANLLDCINIVGEISVLDFSKNDKPIKINSRVFTRKDCFLNNVYDGFYSVDNNNELLYQGIYNHWRFSDIRNEQKQRDFLSSNEFLEIIF